MVAADHNRGASQWRTVARLSDITETDLTDVVVDGRPVLIVRQGDQVMAFQGTCPHQFARLSEGTIVDGALQCPHHLARFNLADGVCTGGWKLPPLQRYEVRTCGDDVQLTDPLRALSG